MRMIRNASWTAFAVAVFGLTATAFAQRGVGEAEGVARWAERPEVVELSGRLERVEVAPCQTTTGRGLAGVHLFLEVEDAPEDQELLNIHLGPADVLIDLVESLENGRHVEVDVFRTEAMEAGHYVARTLRIRDKEGDKEFELRDETLRPFWAGQDRVRAREFAPGWGRGRGAGRGEGRGFGRQGWW